MLYYQVFAAPFNNMRNLKFKARPTNAFFAAVNQMFAGSSQLSTASRARGDQIVVQSSDKEQLAGRTRRTLD